MQERNEGFPSAIEAVFVVIALFAAEYVMAAAFRDARGLFGIEPRDYEGVIALLGNAMLFVVLMHYKSLTYVSLFHASRNSISGTLATLAIPILLVTPALIVSMSAVNAVLV